MGVQSSNRHYFLSLDDLGDTPINTTKDDVLTIRIKRVPSAAVIFFMTDTNDSFVCDLEISGR